MKRYIPRPRWAVCCFLHQLVPTPYERVARLTELTSLAAAAKGGAA